MEKEERRRKFHKTLLNIFYPSHSPSSQEEDAKGDEEELVTMVHEGSDLDFVLDVSHDSDNGDSPCGASEFESQKLTRAQRKRHRRKKLKQESNSGRRKLIGPLLPSMDSNQAVSDEQSSESHELRMPKSDQNPAPPPLLDHGTGDPGGPSACTSQSKLRRRRMGKRNNSKTTERSSSVDASTQVHC